ncbi:LOW QUALITY PROTEIN: hypothetical protein U9M48_029722 [Paspalum notatum var. saurae]|uniref:DUF6598 domain-containing protein n=1 Tax=Paspalum notatum var. saurae TaxID=547442 RepID=A0AAQ3TZG1_PASNO
MEAAACAKGASEEAYIARGERVSEAHGPSSLRRALRQRRDWRHSRRLENTPRSPDLSLITEVERAAEAERLRQERLQEARRLRDKGDTHGASEQEALARITDFDAKKGGFYFNSLSLVDDLATFDLTEESPVGPMRFSNRVFEDKLFVDYAAINILSVKIACSDIGFPIQIYGTVIARDCIDYKRVYLFRRDNDHAQLINSEEEALILMAQNEHLHCRAVMITLRLICGSRIVKGIAENSVKESIPGTKTQSLDKCEAEKVSLATRLSTVDVIYDVVKCAVEATVAVEVVQGEFYGVVTAHTTSSERRILLYDSKVAGGNCYGVIQLMRPAISVYVMDKLMIIAKTTTGDCAAGLKYTPFWNGRNEGVMNLGDTRMHVRD